MKKHCKTGDYMHISEFDEELRRRELGEKKESIVNTFPANYPPAPKKLTRHISPGRGIPTNLYLL